MKLTIKPINISFKKAQKKDLESLYQLDKASDKKYHWCRTNFKTNDKLIIQIDKNIAGFVVYQITDVVEILRIATHPFFYKQGVASALIQELKKYKLPIILELRKNNTKAYNLYQKMNFTEIFLRKKYYKNGEDAKIMRFIHKEG